MEKIKLNADKDFDDIKSLYHKGSNNLVVIQIYKFYCEYQDYKQSPEKSAILEAVNILKNNGTLESAMFKILTCKRNIKK